MIKNVKNITRQDKEPYFVPKRVQDVIPISCVWPDGVFKVGAKFSKTYRFTDINYMVASREDKEGMFLTYSELLNSLDSSATTKLTISNHRQNRGSFEESILMAMRGDGLDEYRKEYNQMLIDKATNGNGIVQEKYVTVTVYKRDVEDARAYFARIGADLTARFAALGSKCVELDAEERLRVLHDFYRSGDEGPFHFDMADRARLGHDFKDCICPDSIEKHSDYLVIGDKFARVLFLKDYASYIKDDMVTELTDLNRNMMLSIDIISVPTDEAVREVESRLLGVETNITNWQRRQNQNNNFSAVIPYDMELQRKESKEFLDDLTTRDQRMMVAVLTMVLTADTKQQLDADTDRIRSFSGQRMCQMSVLKYQQLDGLNTVLPIGVRRISTFRTLTTESLAVFMPFKVQEIMDQGGIYFGENAISHNLIMCNKANLLNQSAFLLGVPGSGKSFSAKELITFIMLNTDDDILICDPEGEYAPLVEAMGDIGTVIRVAAGGRDRLNAMYMVDGYGENNPIVVKSQFIMSLVERIDQNGVGPQQKSIIDRCTAAVYNEAAEMGLVPTLSSLREKLLEQPEEKAKDIALALELFTTGSLDIFGHKSTVDLDKRVVVFDIHGLGEQLKPIGHTNQGQPISPAMENYDPSYPAIQSQAAKSPLERGRDLAKKRAEVRTEKNRRVKNQPACVSATPTPRDEPHKVIHTSTPASAETPARMLGQITRRTGNGRTVPNDIKKIPEQTIKTTQRTIKTAQQSKAAVKTAEQTARTTIKTAEATAKAAQKSAQAAARAEKVAVQTTRASAKAAAVTAKAVAKAAVMAVKASIAAIKGLITALAAGGGIAGIVIVVICLVGLLVGSVFGIFFSGEDTGSGQTMQTAVREINAEYEDKLTEIRAGNPHDVLEMSGSRAVWREVLAVYAVKTTTDPDNPQDVASMDDGKKALLKEIFWAMHTVSYTTAVETRDIVTETDDGSGNIVETSTPTEVTVLYITVAHKTASEMADSYGFTDEQKAKLAQLLDEEYQSLWGAVLYGIGTGDGQIVEVALAQIGNSGDIYWSWYGFDSRVEWCACFVSWCANECGFIDAGIIPKFSSCSRGAEWFKNHGQWQDNTYEPRPGDIIFFDWDERNVGQDGVPNHVGIVEKVENGYVYTVEGNSGDMCRENRYAIGYYEILGYGVPSY